MITWHITRSVPTTATETHSGHTFTASGSASGPYINSTASSSGQNTQGTTANPSATTAETLIASTQVSAIGYTGGGTIRQITTRDFSAGTSGILRTSSATQTDNYEGGSITTFSSSTATTGTLATSIAIQTSTTAEHAYGTSSVATQTLVDYEVPTTTTAESTTTVSAGSSVTTATTTVATVQMFRDYEDPWTTTVTAPEFHTTTISGIGATTTSIPAHPPVELGTAAAAAPGEALVWLGSAVAGVAPASRISAETSTSWWPIASYSQRTGTWETTSRAVTLGISSSRPARTDSTLRTSAIVTAARAYGFSFPAETSTVQLGSALSTSTSSADSQAGTTAATIWDGQATRTVETTQTRTSPLTEMSAGVTTSHSIVVEETAALHSARTTATIAIGVRTSASAGGAASGSTSSALVVDAILAERPVWSRALPDVQGEAIRTAPAVQGYAPQASGDIGSNLNAPGWPYVFISSRAGGALLPVRFPAPTSYPAGTGTPPPAYRLAFSGGSTSATWQDGTASSTTSGEASAIGSQPTRWENVNYWYEMESGTVLIPAGAKAAFRSGSWGVTTYSGKAAFGVSSFSTSQGWTTQITRGHALVAPVPAILGAGELPVGHIAFY